MILRLKEAKDELPLQAGSSLAYCDAAIQIRFNEASWGLLQAELRHACGSHKPSV